MNILVIGGGDIVFGHCLDEVSQSKHYYWLQKFKFNIVGVVEPDPNRHAYISDILTIPVFDNLMELEREDLSYCTVLIASPDNTHLNYLNYFIEKDNVKNIICEKPLGTSSDIIKSDIANILMRKNIYLNLSRRFSQDHIPLFDLNYFKNKDPISIHINYSKGLLHNGIHAVDFLVPILGAKFSFQKISQILDYHVADPTVTVHIWNEQLRVFLNGFDDAHFSIFEIDIIDKETRLCFRRSGLEKEVYEVRPDNIYPGYRELFSKGRKSTDLSSSMKNVYEDLKSNSFQYVLKSSDLIRIVRAHRLIEMIHQADVGGTHIVSW